MKNFAENKKRLVEIYRKELSDTVNKDQMSMLLEGEILLYTLEELGLNGNDIKKGWGILTGYHQRAGRHLIFNEKELTLLAVIRGYIPYIKGSMSYRLLLDQYMNLARTIRLYELVEEEEQLILKCNEPSEFINRKEYLKRLMSYPVYPNVVEKNFFENEVAYIPYEETIEKVRVPGGVTSKSKLSRKGILREKPVAPIHVTKEELLQTAKKMDLLITGRSYYSRVQHIFFEVLKNDDYIERNQLTIDGLFNIVGRVGAGKSTLVEVLTTYLAWKNEKVALVVNSVQDIIKLLNLFSYLKVAVVPIWGYSNRRQHIQKALHSLKEEDFDDILECRVNKWLSEMCPLDGFRQYSDLKETFEVGKEPCMRIKKSVKDRTEYICPYFFECPSHQADINLLDARIYLTTPAAFIKTNISPAVVENQVRVSEILYYMCDLVVFDESDRVQTSFDACFSDAIVLMDETNQSYLNRIGIDVEKWWYENRVENAASKLNTTWYNHFTAAQKTGNKIIYLLTENKALLTKVEGKYYTAHTLLDKLYDEMGENNTQTYINQLTELENFIRRNILDKQTNFYTQAYERILVADTTQESIDEIILKWLGQKEPGGLQRDSIQLIGFIFISAIFEKSLKAMINGIPHIQGIQKLKVDELSIFYRAVKDYEGFVPSSPMGNLFGFRVSTDEKKNLRRVNLFKTNGVGRWLLTHYHCLFEDIEHVKGPNVLLLSGTSWAPKAYSYHIENKVDAILKGTEQDIQAIAESTFIFEGIRREDEAINVSGKQGISRELAIRNILDQLFVNPIGPRQKLSLIERELGILEPARKKILLFVGSYQETKQVKSYLDQLGPNKTSIKKEEIIALVGDAEENEDFTESIARGRVEEFGISENKILIAPLLALERGHNILNDEQVAAIGAVYFIIRPMPVPNAMSTIVHKLNSGWMQRLNQGYYRSIQEYMYWVKQGRDQAMRRMQTLIIQSEHSNYQYADSEEREALCMNSFVTMCQVIGRLVRGGCKARVHFCDSKFAPESIEGRVDTETTSILVGIIRVLAKYFEEDGTMCDLDKKIAYQLYYAFYKGLKDCEGLNYDR